MKCDNCKKEDTWLEYIGKNFICKKCVTKHKIMGLIFRTHIDTFKFLLRKLEPKNYEEYLIISRKDIEKHVDLKKYGIKLKTTNIIELE